MHVSATRTGWRSEGSDASHFRCAIRRSCTASSRLTSWKRIRIPAASRPAAAISAAITVAMRGQPPVVLPVCQKQDRLPAGGHLQGQPPVVPCDGNSPSMACTDAAPCKRRPMRIEKQARLHRLCSAAFQKRLA